MISADLKDKWETIEDLPREGDYDHIRITAECHAEISLGISPDGARCLILILPKLFSIDFHTVEREKLSLTKVPSKNYIVLTLLDSDFCDLFDDLIVSMYNSIQDIKDVETYSTIFIKTFHKWSQFFDRGYGGRLDRSVIQGIFGEIIYLKKLLLELPASKANHALESWRGPYDQGNDFILEDKDVEVKTHVVGNTSVRITSEDQLDQNEGKGLELAVVTVDSNSPNGIPLSKAVSDTVAIIEGHLADVTIFYAALNQKNLGPMNLCDYDDIVFKATEVSNYNCLADEFPRIVRSELPEQLFSVRYSLNSSKLEGYLITCEAL
jgi:hypothetical protein